MMLFVQALGGKYHDALLSNLLLSFTALRLSTKQIAVANILAFGDLFL